ncbi:neurogenic protein mastermind-like isoform X2 [Anthonomus grandis grandis]|uniref:neurogenic protein mastermind-like isoform X2 n=1 Tax=Anthonomus grandis grandis TaxID=2921223 RepID=UPI00216688C7|nr:neurogenic protein mastermind-like isoform X2 [Anthonomus grandis grandis]
MTSDDERDVLQQQKFLKRTADELGESGGASQLDNGFEQPPVKLQCTAQQQHGTAVAASSNQEGLTKFSVEIVQQLEFTTSAASAQPQQISTNVTVKTHANASVKSDVASPKAGGGAPSQTPQKLDVVGTLVECVKQEPDNDFADLDQCAAALEKDAAANGGAGFGASFPDLIGDDTNDEIMSSAAFKDLISDISNYPDYPELMKDFDFEDKPSDLVMGNLKTEEKEHNNSGGGGGGGGAPNQDQLKSGGIQSPLMSGGGGQQTTFGTSPAFEKNNNPRLPYSNMDFAKTELSPAAQTLKQMAEQHQHKNQMGLNFNPGNPRGQSAARSPYSEQFQFQNEYSPGGNPAFHKNSPGGFPQPDMIKQEMIFQGNEFSDMKRKNSPYGAAKQPQQQQQQQQQQYSPYGSPGPGGSPGFLPSGRGGAGGPPPPRPPSGPGNNQNGGGGGPSVQINQAQQLNINQQSHGHIQVSAGQQFHLSADLKGGNVSIAAQQGMNFSSGGGAQSGGDPGATPPQQHQQGAPGGSSQMPPMGNPQMSHGNMMGGGHPGVDSYSMSQTQTINFTQQSLRRATPAGMGGPMGGTNGGPPQMGPMGGARLMSTQALEQQKLQQIFRVQQQMQQQQQQQQLRPPPPEYAASAGLGGQGGMQPRYGAPAPPPNMRRMPHQPIPPSGPMIRSNGYMMQQQQLQQQQQQQQQLAGRAGIYRQSGPMAGMEAMQQNAQASDWRHLLMSQQQNASFGSMRPSAFQPSGGFNMNQMTAMQQHQQQQQQQQQHMRQQQQGGAMGAHMMGAGNPMAQMSQMNQAMLHMQQQQSLMQQQQQNSQMSMSTLHMQQSQSISIGGHQQQQQQPPPHQQQDGGGAAAASQLAAFNPQAADFNFEFLDNLAGTNDGAPFTDQELLNSFDADAAFNLDF